MPIGPNDFLKRALTAVVLAFLAQSISAADAPPVVESTCSNCHGNDGISDEESIPTIAGASAFFLENQLLIYAEEARPCAASEFEAVKEVEAADHCALAGELPEESILAAAEYYAGQPFSPAEQTVDPALAERGASIHERSCDKCHAEGGSLALDDAGILAGQWKPYIVEQMQAFQAGERWQPEKMQPKVEELSAEDIEALAEYYASQGAERF